MENNTFSRCLYYAETSFKSPLAYLFGFFGFMTGFAVLFGNLTVMQSIIIIITAICAGALLHFALFHLPGIALGQLKTGGPVQKLIGVAGLAAFALAIYGVWKAVAAVMAA